MGLLPRVLMRNVSRMGRERQPQMQGRCSVVRELHVYGTAVTVHARDSSKHQHQVQPCRHPSAAPPCSSSLFHLSNARLCRGREGLAMPSNVVVRVDKCDCLSCCTCGGWTCCDLAGLWAAAHGGG